MEHRTSFKQLLILLICSTFAPSLSSRRSQPYQGRWKYLKRNLGISAMHIALLPTEKIIAFDWTNGASNISLPQCPPIVPECTAHSVEFDPLTRKVRPLTILSDTWCSSGALSPDGVLVQTGGFVLGDRVVRYLKPCQGCDWKEDRNGLLKPRWYATNQVLPDGRAIVVGGLSQFSYEFIPRRGAEEDFAVRQLPFLKETMTSLSENNNLYPFVHLGPDGNLFIFANDRAILLDYVKNKVLRKYPVFPGGFSHNYPSTGSSVLLPLKLSGQSRSVKAEVLICGGTDPSAFQKAMAKTRHFVPASKFCGRLAFTDQTPEWKIEEMPMRRIMGDMILLPTGDVLIVNGAARGAAGWDNARSPVTSPVMYKVNAGDGEERFEVLAGSEIPRLYHSSAHLLSDGRVLVGGSNPNSRYNFSTLFPTELSLEAFYPPYLTSGKPRPKITAIEPEMKLLYNSKISVHFQLGSTQEAGNNINLTMVAPSFTTHSLSMHQRVLALRFTGIHQVTPGNLIVEAETPVNAALAPPGYYILFVVNDGIPSRGKWVHIE